MNTERDLAWQGYALRAIVPDMLLGGILTVAMLAFNRWLDPALLFGDPSAALVVVPLILTLWASYALFAFYRGCRMIRLTDQRLYFDEGFLHRPIPGVPLQGITAVDVDLFGPGIWLDVGKVTIHVEGREPIRRAGLVHPDLFAQAVRDAAARVKF